MKPVTKPSSPRKCTRCGKRIKPKPAGRPASFCSASCRQRAYEKRKWTPYDKLDAAAWVVLPEGTRRKVTELVRLDHMIELLTNGTVPLNDVAQIDGVLDAVEPPKRMPLLRRIEQACQRRGTKKRWASSGLALLTAATCQGKRRQMR